jgi:lipoate-protein ligase B
VDRQKIASIGIAIRNWITFHGLSVNIKQTDLDSFSLIRPCGMDIKMTSLETVLGEDIEFNAVKKRFIRKFKEEAMDDKCSFTRTGRGN